jgi:mono/diheme cytochrome c family protein
MRRAHIAAALVLLSAACGHGAAAGTKPGAPAPNANPAPKPQKPGAEGSEEISAYMAEHFVVATWARDSVINGNLDALRRPLRALADYRYSQVAPGGWLPAIARLQEAARLTADAETLDLAAGGVAVMGRVCGECHRENHAGPRFIGGERDEGKTKSDTLGTRMYRHMWAADRLWEGLTGPSDEAWRAGAQALVRAPEQAPRTQPPLPPQFASALLQVRELGQRALEADSLADRANVYGLFLASCASCHALQVGLEF